MPFTGGDHAPLALRNFVGYGDGGLSITVVVDAWEGWVDCNLSKGFVHFLYLTFIERLTKESLYNLTSPPNFSGGPPACHEKRERARTPRARAGAEPPH